MHWMAIRIGQFLSRWLFRLRGPEPAPIVLNQRRVFVLPTRAGLAFGATVILLLIGSINYFLSLGYVLTFHLAGLGIVAIVHAFRNLVRLEIAPGRCEPVFAGDTAAFPLFIRNSRPDPRLGLELHLHHGKSVVVDIPGHTSIKTEIPVAAHRRGWQHLDRVTLETTFPLSLIRAWSYVHPDMRCLVYPAPEREAPPLPLGSDGLRGSQVQPSGNDDFASLRPHQPSDSPRQIAWKVAARDGPLLTKQFAGNATGSVRLDWLRMDSRLDAEARLSRLAAWVLTANASQTAFSMRLPGVEFPTSSGESHVRRCLEALALYAPSAR
jgi:uncharacterized protein (DUF58 family)